MEARLVRCKVARHTNTLSWWKLIVEIWGTVCTGWWIIYITLVAVFVCTGIAGIVNLVFNIKSTTKILTKTWTQVEIVIGRITSPCHHIEYIRLTPTKATSIGKSPWSEHIYTELDGSIYGFIDKLPLILEPASCISGLKGSDSHDKVVYEFDRDG